MSRPLPSGSRSPPWASSEDEVAKLHAELKHQLALQVLL